MGLTQRVASGTTISGGLWRFSKTGLASKGRSRSHAASQAMLPTEAQKRLRSAAWPCPHWQWVEPISPAPKRTSVSSHRRHQPLGCRKVVLIVCSNRHSIGCRSRCWQAWLSSLACLLRRLTCLQSRGRCSKLLCISIADAPSNAMPDRRPCDRAGVETGKAQHLLLVAQVAG